MRTVPPHAQLVVQIVFRNTSTSGRPLKECESGEQASRPNGKVQLDLLCERTHRHGGGHRQAPLIRSFAGAFTPAAGAVSNG